MLRHDAKFPVSRTDVWGVLTLAVFIGLIFTLAVRGPTGGDHSLRVTVSSSAPPLQLDNRL